MWYSIIRLPLADCISLYYQSPIVIAILGRVFLGEKLPFAFPLVVLCALIGVVLISQPLFLLRLIGVAHDESESYEPLHGVGLVRKAKNAHWLQLEMAMSTQMLLVLFPLLMICNHFANLNIIGDWTDWRFDI